MKKLTRRLILSIISLTFAMITFGTSTYAWFSLNKVASVTGMQLDVVTESDMLIGKLEDVATDTAIDVDSAKFKTAIAVTADPVTITASSSIDGMNFYKANTAINGAGQLEEDKYIAVTNPTDIAQTQYYTQYDYVIKYVNPTDTEQTVDVTQLELKYAGSVDPSRAFRVAFITTSCTTTLTDGKVTSSVIDGTPTAQGIYKSADALYFETDKAANSETTKDTITAISEHLFSCPANQTTFIKVSVVVWLEGEDSTCRNDIFADLTKSWTFSFKVARTGAEGETKVENLTLSVTE